MEPKNLKMCANCVMDTSDPGILFDEDGICNHCLDFREASVEWYRDEKGEQLLNALVKKIKEEGKDLPYDCLIGLSGGVDSSYVAFQCKRLGLRPLAVHLDNGWNSELAVSNIENILKNLGIDLYTIVVDWEEFKSLQLAYIKASVIDIEAVSDHAIVATMWKIAKEKKIRYIIAGTNFASERILPKAWYYPRKLDLINLKDIYRKHGDGRELKTYPMLSFSKWLYLTWAIKIQFVSILDYMNYNPSEAREVLTREVGWRDYGGKHHESFITKFYQSYILYKKFGVDKRKAHYSSLINAGFLKRSEALNDLEHPPYNPDSIDEEILYFTKKMNLSQIDFDEIMNTPPRSHFDFKNDKLLWNCYNSLLNTAVKIKKSVFG